MMTPFNVNCQDSPVKVHIASAALEIVRWSNFTDGLMSQRKACNGDAIILV